MKYKIIIGVVGQIASGKGVLVNWLTSHLGFKSFSLSSIVHAELKKKGIKEFTRQTLQNVGDELRRKYGDDVLAHRIMTRCRGRVSRPIIIEGIRNPAEIKFLKKNQNFILIGVKSNREIRFKRLLSRDKKWDPKNYEDFLKVDRRDIGVSQGKSGQQVGKCLAYCDYTLTNNKSIDEFEEKIEELMKQCFTKYT